MGSPPPLGSKKEVLKFRSNNNIVIAPAKTGRERRSKKAVRRTDQAKRGVNSGAKPAPRMLIIVTRKLIAPAIELIPARCKEKIAKSTEEPECPRDERGG